MQRLVYISFLTVLFLCCVCKYDTSCRMCCLHFMSRVWEISDDAATFTAHRTHIQYSTYLDDLLQQEMYFRCWRRRTINRRRLSQNSADSIAEVDASSIDIVLTAYDTGHLCQCSISCCRKLVRNPMGGLYCNQADIDWTQLDYCNTLSVSWHSIRSIRQLLSQTLCEIAILIALKTTPSISHLLRFLTFISWKRALVV